MFYIASIKQSLLLEPCAYSYDIEQTLNNRLVSMVEGSCSGSYGYIISVLSVLSISEGLVQHTGHTIFEIRYKALTLNVSKGDVVDAMVSETNRMGIFATIGPVACYVQRHFSKMVGGERALQKHRHHEMALCRSRVSDKALACTQRLPLACCLCASVLLFSLYLLLKFLSLKMEQRRKRAPGIQVHISAIKDINNQINSLSERITEYKGKIDDELRRSSERAENTRIRVAIRELDESIRSLKAKRSTHLDEKSTLVAEFNGLKEEVSGEKRRINFGSLDELEKKEKEVNYKLMVSKVTPQQEREISATLSEIKKKRIDLQNLGSKESRLNVLNTRIGELNELLKTSKNEIDEKRKKIDSLKQDLQNLVEKGKNKSDVVVDYEKKIEEFKKTKNDLYERRKAEQNEIVKKEEAYDKYLKALAEVQEQESQRKAVKERIKRFDDDRNALLNEQTNYNPKKFDELAEALKCIVGKDKDLKIPISLVKRLNEVGVKLPRDKKDVENTIEALRRIKSDFEKTAYGHLEKIERRISELDIKIENEKRVLESMPQTDIKLRKEPIY
ncbi:UNVERIFIED_CONTAM: hypothetical protein PYX00_011785 [Menopon gallinae]|uniref:RNA polymerase Rpb7-like N-terminal domain-containing protein n=1 Tax=Menopon gallinae TaxID=328185 RepID=A0AAW2H8P3_9NEOP